jgi:hypothetical protein
LNALPSSLPRTVVEFCASARDTAERGDLATALEMVVAMVNDVNSHENNYGRVFASRELDQLCIDLGRLSTLSRPPAQDGDHRVFLVTAIFASGGHTRVLRDLIDADPGQTATILVTNVQHDIQPGELDPLLDGCNVQIELAPRANYAVRLQWLQTRLFELRPARTYILQHPFDPLCVAAAQPELVGRLFYYHNCDYMMATGVHVAHATHIDFNAKGFYHCRDVNGVRDGVIWPLTTDVTVHRRDLPFRENGYLTTCTSGGFEKFDPIFVANRVPYYYDYANTLPLVLRATGGRHIHVGSLFEPTREAIEVALRRAGIERERFVWVPFVPNLAQALVDYNVDVYLTSFPLGGGRTLVEAMGAGMPLIVHSNYRSAFFTDLAEAYPGALGWRGPNELQAVLQGLSVEVLRDHSARARKHFECFHRPELLGQAIAAALADQPVTPPERPTYEPDTLQQFLDETLAAGRALELAVERAGAEVRDSLATELSATADERESLREKLAEAHAQSAKLMAEAQLKEAERQNAREALASVEVGRQNALEALATAEAKLETAHAENTNVRSERDSLVAGLRHLEALHTSLGTELEDQRSRLAECVALAAYWQGRYEGLRARLEAILRRYGIVWALRLVPSSARGFVRQRLLGPQGVGSPRGARDANAGHR